MNNQIIYLKSVKNWYVSSATKTNGYERPNQIKAEIEKLNQQLTGTWWKIWILEIKFTIWNEGKGIKYGHKNRLQGAFLK